MRSEVRELTTETKVPPCARTSSAPSALVIEASLPVKATRLPFKTCASETGSGIRHSSLRYEEIIEESATFVIQERSQPRQACRQINAWSQDGTPQISYCIQPLYHGAHREPGGIETSSNLCPFQGG